MAKDKSLEEKLAEYSEAKKEARQWREHYREYERLANNGLRDDLEENLPEVNDGSLAAALFKLPKRVVPEKLVGRARALNDDHSWKSELANIQWESNIIPNANLQAPFMRKWKHAVRAAGIYGGVPLITMFNQKGKYTGSDFIVAHPQDVTLEKGKVSDMDSDVFYWDMYFSKRQIKQQIELHKKEEKAAKEEGRESYNTWNVKALQELLDNAGEEERNGEDKSYQEEQNGAKSGGIKLTAIIERGVNSYFCIVHKGLNLKVREWTNPDSTGDAGIHYLYCYQDFVNPYGIGIVKLAGGTQNVLDYMRQADVLSTQIGLEPPIQIAGNADTADEESMVYSKAAKWYTGQAEVTRMQLGDNIYSQLPNRISMYKTSLNQLIPTGDTSIGASAGDPEYSKTPAGVKFQAANLSIDDQDFKNNLFEVYAAKARSMINYHFANMQGSDLMELSDEEKERLMKAGAPQELFARDEQGEPTNEFQIFWDDVRAEFDFEVEPEAEKATDEQARLEGGLKILELTMQRPDIEQRLEMKGKRLDLAELFEEVIGLLSDNDRIIQDIDPEDQAQNQAIQGDDPEQIQTLMQGFGVDEQTAQAMLEAERQGFSQDEILEYVQGQEAVSG